MNFGLLVWVLTSVLAILMFIFSIIAFKKVRTRRVLTSTIIFGIFAVKSIGVLVFILLQDINELFLITIGVLDFLILLLFLIEASRK